MLQIDLDDEESELRTMAKDQSRQEPPEGLRRRAEETLSTKKTGEPCTMPEEDVRALVHELQVHQIELEMQNEELTWANALVEETRNRYVDLYELAPIGYLTLDENGMVLEANLTAAVQLGIERSGLIRRPFQDYIVPADWDKFRSHLNDVVTSKKRQSCEIGLMTKSGGDFYALLDTVFILDSSGKKLCRTTATDITERKRMETARSRLAAIVESSDDAIISKAMDGEIISWNRAAEKLYGYTAKEVVGRSISVLAPNDRPDDMSAILQSISRGEDFKHYDTIRRRKDGRNVHVSLSISAIRDASGKITGASVIAHDITERKRMEEELRLAHDELELRVKERTGELEKVNADLTQSNTKLEMLNQELQEFAFIASHDLQEPLRKIQTFGNMLIKNHKDSLSSDGKDYMERVTKAASRMSELLRALLNYSKAGTSELNYKHVSLTDAAKDAASDLEYMIAKAKGTVEISELPTVDADAALLRQLFHNVIGNSMKYRRESEPPIVKIYGSIVDSVCQVFIEDNGIGFEEEFTHKIFKPFERLHGRSAPYKGTGMGLAICRKIAARHGGDITARSTPGQGSTFIVTLPAKQQTGV
jgi:PAS domain S-box-containing protein